MSPAKGGGIYENNNRGAVLRKYYAVQSQCPRRQRIRQSGRAAGTKRGGAACNADRSTEGDLRKDQGLLDGNEQHQRSHDIYAWIQAGAAAHSGVADQQQGRAGANNRIISAIVFRNGYGGVFCEAVNYCER